MMVFRLAIICFAIGLVSMAVPAEAHRVGIPVTTIKWHMPSQTWHLVHRVSAHDLEPALGLEGTAREEIYETRDGQARIAQYVLSHFAIEGEAEPIEISYLGAENEADQVWMYFTLRSPDQTVTIKNRMLLSGSEEGQYALVNIGQGHALQTLLFDFTSGPQTAFLKQP